jgi:hypothetical protein
MTEQQELIEKIATISHRIDKGGKTILTILGKEYKLTDTKRKVIDNIIDIAYDVNYGKENDKKKQFQKVRTGDIKAASYLILNGLSYIPFLHAIHWRYIWRFKTTEVFSGIIAETLNSPEIAFFLKGSMGLNNLLLSRTQMIKTEQE